MIKAHTHPHTRVTERAVGVGAPAPYAGKAVTHARSEATSKRDLEAAMIKTKAPARDPGGRGGGREGRLTKTERQHQSQADRAKQEQRQATAAAAAAATAAAGTPAAAAADPPGQVPNGGGRGAGGRGRGGRGN